MFVSEGRAGGEVNGRNSRAAVYCTVHSAAVLSQPTGMPASTFAVSALVIGRRRGREKTIFCLFSSLSFFPARERIPVLSSPFPPPKFPSPPPSSDVARRYRHRGSSSSQGNAAKKVRSGPQIRFLSFLTLTQKSTGEGSEKKDGSSFFCLFLCAK